MGGGIGSFSHPRPALRSFEISRGRRGGGGGGGTVGEGMRSFSHPRPVQSFDVSSEGMGNFIEKP